MHGQVEMAYVRLHGKFAVENNRLKQCLLMPIVRLWVKTAQVCVSAKKYCGQVYDEDLTDHTDFADLQGNGPRFRFPKRSKPEPRTLRLQF